ncbi:hypothetical protein [Streptomyces sp. NRRL S-1022]|uniref:hypothetical protein n=1 Tax=Streptomyces sp. NRRL S-1022 TaxID=1463880 RepID=UPI00131EB89B|nr:hypothetical protein [Streptomyces sp. NRRL S-1022]
MMTKEYLAGALETAPGASLIATTTTFDAVVLPRDIGMHAMILLDREVSVPCLLQNDDTTLLLVLPATGRYCLVHPDVSVRTGEDGWIALPPSRGVRWDTPPWIEVTGVPRPLTHGEDVGRILRQAFSYVGGTMAVTA